jgi:hypothetical protein
MILPIVQTHVQLGTAHRSTICLARASGTARNLAGAQKTGLYHPGTTAPHKNLTRPHTKNTMMRVDILHTDRRLLKHKRSLRLIIRSMAFDHSQLTYKTFFTCCRKNTYIILMWLMDAL